MSSSIISSLDFDSREVAIYLGTFTLIAGVLGGLLNAIVFLSLQTFRQSSCAFYLTVMSLVNIGQLLTGFLGRIVISGFGIDWTQTSLFYCKIRSYCVQVCAVISLTCICLSTIDQYFATCSRPRWQQWSNVKLARRLSATFVLFWMLHSIPYLVYYNQIVSTTTGKVMCIVTNNVYQQYITYVNIVTLGRILPICVTYFFGFLAYRNVQQLAHRTLPLVRRELDKQLTVMVLVQVVFSFFTIIPYVVVYLLMTMPNLTQDPLVAAKLQFAFTLTQCIYYIYFASPFYIYFCASDRFRRQLIYVLFDIHLNRWRRQTMTVNQVMPQI